MIVREERRAQKSVPNKNPYNWHDNHGDVNHVSLLERAGYANPSPLSIPELLMQ